VNWFAGLADPQRLLEAWRKDYNESRPDSSLNEQTPAELAHRIKEMGPA
jgi:putative transposase